MHRHSALETIYKVGKYSSSEKQSLTFKELKSLEIPQLPILKKQFFSTIFIKLAIQKLLKKKKIL